MSEAEDVRSKAEWYAGRYGDVWLRTRTQAADSLLASLGGTCRCGEPLTVGHAAGCGRLRDEVLRLAVRRMERLTLGGGELE